MWSLEHHEKAGGVIGKAIGDYHEPLNAGAARLACGI